MQFRRIVAVAASIAIPATLIGGVVAPQPAEAAISAKVASPGVVAAPDIKSKGVIKTPSWELTGDQYNSWVYDYRYSSSVYQGKKKIATTSTEGKAIKVKAGTYTVKTTAKYRVTTGHEKQRTDWAWGYSDYPEPVTEGCQTRRVSAVDTSSSWTEFDIEIKCADGRKATGVMSWWPDYYSDTDPATVWPLNSWGTHTSDEYWSWSMTDAYGPTETWDYWETTGPWKTVTKTQKIKVGKNSGTMTMYEYKKIKNKMKRSKVTSIVGGAGVVAYRYSYGKHDYLDVSYDKGRHWVYFDNGKVSAKSWS